MLIQAEVPILEEIPEAINIGEKRLIIFLEGRKPGCFFRASWKVTYGLSANPSKEGEEKEGESNNSNNNTNFSGNITNINTRSVYTSGGEQWRKKEGWSTVRKKEWTPNKTSQQED